MQPFIRMQSYLNHRYPVGSMGGGGGRGKYLEHLQKGVFLCWSFLEVYIFAITYQKGTKGTLPHPNPYLPYPTLPYPTPLNLPYPTPAFPTISYPFPTLPYPPITYPPLSYPTPFLPFPSLPILSYPTPTLPHPLRIHTHAHNQASHSRGMLSCDSSALICSV